MPQNLNLNQFTITNLKGRVNMAPALNTRDFQIDAADVTNTYYPGTFVTLTATGSVVKSLAADTKIIGMVIYNDVVNVHTSTLNFVVTVALNETECTAEAGATIAAGDKLEYNPTGDVLIPWAGINTVVGVALEPATVGNTFAFKLNVVNQ